MGSPVILAPGQEGLAGCAAVRKVAAYLELTKPRITALILLVTLAGFWLGSRGAPDGRRMLDTLFGVALLAGGIFALNQYLERDLDARMQRTTARPLPSGRLRPREALTFGTVLSLAAVLALAMRGNAVTALMALATLSSYLFLYTPLKRSTPHCTLIGAFPGAAPPLVGWAAATGELGLGAWALFGILFLWQFPHFHSIAYLYRDDYARADIRLWPVIEREGKTTPLQIVASAFLLLPVSLAPVLLDMTGPAYFWGALGLGLAFFCLAVRTALDRSCTRTQQLLFASVVYLPALFVLMVLDKR